MLTSLERLQAIKANIAAGRQPWVNQLQAMKAAAADARLYTPPSGAIYCGSYNKDPQGNKVQACDWVVENGIDAYTFALLGYLTADRSYSDKSIQYIMQWADGDFKGFDPAGSNSPLQAGWSAPWYANAAEILRYTYPGWTPQHTSATDRLLNLFYPRVKNETDAAGNNWLHSRIEAHMAIAIWRDDKAMLNTAIDQWKANTPSYFYIASDGAYPPEPRGRDFAANTFKSRYWAGAVNFKPGMSMETCRDLNHQDLGVRSIVNSLQMARTQGIDALAGTDIRTRLTTFLETQAQWRADQRVPSDMCDGPVIVQPGSSPVLMKDAQPVPYEMAYEALYTTSNPLPKTSAAIKARPSTVAARWVRKWETLTHHFEPPM
jgi:Alginate lyase